MLSDLSQCAYRLGMAFGGEAERAQDAARRLEYFQLFDRCFFAVRVATALELRLLRTPVAPRREAATEREDLSDRDRSGHEPLDIERPERFPERLDAERDREREVEPASLPLLLRTLQGVAADAAGLPGPEPAALPTLRQLLAHVTSDAPAVTPTTAPPTAAASLRARLAGSGAASALALAPPQPSRPGGALAMRRATGPPDR
jgi:hypothetical protein